MFRFNAIIIDLDKVRKEATYHFPTRKGARHWARRNIRRGWVEEAVLFDFGCHTPLAAWATDGDGDYTRYTQQDLLAA